ncbi:MAG: hypothetical protein BJ554DRAFT_6484, partial [Olpidium bornovanus]
RRASSALPGRPGARGGWRGARFRRLPTTTTRPGEKPAPPLGAFYLRDSGSWPPRAQPDRLRRPPSAPAGAAARPRPRPAGAPTRGTAPSRRTRAGDVRPSRGRRRRSSPAGGARPRPPPPPPPPPRSRPQNRRRRIPCWSRTRSSGARCRTLQTPNRRTAVPAPRPVGRLARPGPPPPASLPCPPR